MNREPRVLYHYCSLNTFLNIFNSKSIWLSDISKSNDSNELQWILGECYLRALKAWHSYIASIEQTKGLDSLNAKNLEEVDNLLKFIKEFDNIRSWVFCLSEKSDDLGQWRGYADDGYGIAIGFNKAHFSAIKSIRQIFNPDYEKIRFERVKYSRKSISDFFNNKAGLSKISSETSVNDVINIIKRCIAFSLWECAFFKNYKFYEEKEWRIVYSMPFSDLLDGKSPIITNDKNPYLDTITFNKYEFIQKNNTLVSHIELGLPKFKNAIHSITIGPKSPLTKIDLKLYLISIGLLDNIEDTSIEIRKSEISYR